ncbi:hypothetical protein RSAG8_08059, partial [Rhizoctonia solani AG-8 WAC10335]
MDVYWFGNRHNAEFRVPTGCLSSEASRVGPVLFSRPIGCARLTVVKSRLRQQAACILLLDAGPITGNIHMIRTGYNLANTCSLHESLMYSRGLL